MRKEGEVSSLIDLIVSIVCKSYGTSEIHRNNFLLGDGEVSSLIDIGLCQLFVKVVALLNSTVTNCHYEILNQEKSRGKM